MSELREKHREGSWYLLSIFHGEFEPTAQERQVEVKVEGGLTSRGGVLGLLSVPMPVRGTARVS